MSIRGKTIVFTGKISRPRHEFQRIVEEHGGVVGSDVSSKTDYLVVGEKPGSKLFRANMLNIPTITEEEFLKLLEEEPQTLLPEESPCHGPTPVSHFWFRETIKEDGDVIKECLCGSTLIHHKDGSWEKREPRHVIERARRIAHQHAVEEERLQRKKEAEAIKFIESLTPEQREELRIRYCVKEEDAQV